MGLGTGRERVGAFDEPPEREEGGAGEDGGAPGVGVPAAVLPHGEPPLVPQRRRVGDRGLRGVRVSSAPGVSSAVAGQAGSGAAALRRLWRRRRRRRRDGLLLVVGHSGLTDRCSSVLTHEDSPRRERSEEMGQLGPISGPRQKLAATTLRPSVLRYELIHMFSYLKKKKV